MSHPIMIPRARVYELLQNQGLVLTDMRNPENVVWYNKKDGQHYLVPDHQNYPPSIVFDLLHHILGTESEEATELIDEVVLKVIYR